MLRHCLRRRAEPQAQGSGAHGTRGRQARSLREADESQPKRCRRDGGEGTRETAILDGGELSVTSVLNA